MMALLGPIAASEIGARKAVLESKLKELIDAAPELQIESLADPNVNFKRLSTGVYSIVETVGELHI